MAKAETNVVIEIKKLLEEKKLIIGTQRTIKNLKAGKTGKIFVCSNPSVAMKEDLAHYSKISGVQIIELDIPNDELGIICKKPYAIAMLSTAK